MNFFLSQTLREDEREMKQSSNPTIINSCTYPCDEKNLPYLIIECSNSDKKLGSCVQD